MLEGHPLDQFGKMTLGEQFGSMLSTIKQSITSIKDAIIEWERFILRYLRLLFYEFKNIVRKSRVFKSSANAAVTGRKTKL